MDEQVRIPVSYPSFVFNAGPTLLNLLKHRALPHRLVEVWTGSLQQLWVLEIYISLCAYFQVLQIFFFAVVRLGFTQLTLIMSSSELVRPPRSHGLKTYYSAASEKFFMPHACFMYVISLVECSKHGDAHQKCRLEFESTRNYVCLVSLMALVISWWNYTVLVTHCWR
jgi:hypothetical protein